MAPQKVTQARNGGTQTVYRFDNGYGASIVNHSYSYGTEMAVILFSGPSMEDWNICYTTPITDDVLGHLSPEDVERYLDLIQLLPSPF